MDSKPVKEYVSLSRRIGDLKAELKQAEHETKELEQIVVNEMINAGFQEVTADGRTLKLRRKVEAHPADGRRTLTEALQEAGLDALVSYNDSTIRAYVKEVAAGVLDLAEREERDPTGEEIQAAFPEPVGRALTVHLGFELSNTKA